MLTLSQVLDALAVDTLSVLVDVRHEEALEVPCNRAADRVDCYPFCDRRRLDVA